MNSPSSLTQSTTAVHSVPVFIQFLPLAIVLLIMFLFYLPRIKRFWGSRVLGSPDSNVIELDVTPHARALGVLRWTEYYLAFSWVFAATSILYMIINGGSASDLLLLPLTALYCWAAFTCFRDSGHIDPRRWHPLLLVLSILLAVVAIYGTFFVYIAGNFADVISDPSLFKSYLKVLAMFVLTGVFAVMGIASILALLRRKLSGLGITVRMLTAYLHDLSEDCSQSSAKLKRISPFRGTIHALLAGTIILGTLLFSAVSERDEDGTWLGFFVGYFFALRARLYFQVSADSLLSVDKRPPILFLRSFDDDELQPSRSPSKALLDFSLEARLASHFMRFGPFIAVGRPGERVPNLGAARALLPNDQWQRSVLDWINEAALIVMYAGKTRWVKWELERIIQTGHVSRLILLVPEIKAWSTAKRDQELAQRAAQLRVIFRHTQWAEQLNSWWDYFSLRAVVFRPDGSVVAIKSGSRSRDSYHLSALVAHYVLEFPTAFTSGTGGTCLS